MSDDERQFVWVRYNQPAQKSPASGKATEAALSDAELAARAKAGQERRRLLIAARKAVAAPPGTVPEVWPLYTSTDDAGIAAEHVAAGIWGTHQQGDPDHPVHEATAKTDKAKWPTNFGGACRRLFDVQFNGDAQVRSPIDTMAEDTISKRLAVLSRTDEVAVAASHITSLVRLMRASGTCIAFDYTDLYWAIRNWTDLEKRTATMHRWSRSYFLTKSQKAADPVGAEG
jgi:hypothetical protein